VFRFAFRYLGNESDSEEVTGDTFFRVFRNAARFTPKASVKTWIFTIALNLSRDRLRKGKKQKRQVSFEDLSRSEKSGNDPLEAIDSKEPSPSEQAQSNEGLAQIQHCIGLLPEKLRFPFIFCVLEHHSYDECATILNTNRKTVETRIYRARQTLKAILEEHMQKV
jgi:RNA polymerase sigma-70 factor (ECF subfamily)